MPTADGPTNVGILSRRAQRFRRHLGAIEMAGPTAEEQPAVVPSSPHRKLSVLPLTALVFYEVCGGPFGVEDSVRAGGGPFLALLGFLVLPLLWSLPEALVTAELATAFPSNGGYVVWVSAAFGPFWAFQQGLWKWTSGVMDNALYPLLFLDYLRLSHRAARSAALFSLTAALTYLNYRGLHVVGLSAVVLAVFSVSPFAVMAVLALPRIRPRRWLQLDPSALDWRGYFNTMFWNLNYWDKASTVAGEVEDPGRVFPRAVVGAVGLVVGSYLVPLLAGTGALDGSRTEEWTDGFFADVGMAIGGRWLKWWIQAAAAMSNMGLFEAEMSSDAFQLLGMSEMGMIPAVFASRSKYGTPTISILCSATGVIVLSFMSFQEVIEFLNFLYAIGMLLEFAAFIKLRVKKPDLDRPYKIPLSTFWVTVFCIPPSFLLILVMCLASLRTFIVSGVAVIVGILLYPLINYIKDRGLVDFISTPIPCDPGSLSHQTLSHIAVEEAACALLPEDASILE